MIFEDKAAMKAAMAAGAPCTALVSATGGMPQRTTACKRHRYHAVTPLC
jgi:hypothetical protein